MLIRQTIEGIFLGLLIVTFLSLFIVVDEKVVERSYYYQLAYPNPVTP